MNQTATSRINGTTGKLTKILKGARQGCRLFPEFFNAYGEEMKTNEEYLEGVRVGRGTLPGNNLRFTDDSSINYHKQQKLQ